MTRISAAALAALLLVAGACAKGDDSASDSAADTTATTIGPVPSDSVMPLAPGALMSPESASRQELASLPGMTPALADSIVARRPIASMLVVDSILGRTLSEAQRDTIYARMFKPIDLNAATDAEIQLIPGIGRRMLHEFKEYRPYDGIARFRREMGKYVDSTEVARMEKYVRVEP